MNVKSRTRVDDHLVTLGLAPNKSRAQAFLMAGLIERWNLKKEIWEKVEKSGEAVREGEKFRMKESEWAQDVGRGAQKLRGALKAWPEVAQRVTGSLALDIGSSTGGFTQVLLENGARQVVALDVGTHQLHERLRGDVRVLSLEKTHVLQVQESDWAPWGVQLPFGIFVCDVSFISVGKVIPHVWPWLKVGGDFVFLLKPQFELEPKKTPGGIVKKPEHHQEAIDKILQVCQGLPGLEWKERMDSPIFGGDGNKEFLVWLRKH